MLFWPSSVAENWKYFDDDINEDFTTDQIDYDDLNTRSATNIAGICKGITMSQPLVVDSSVDSLALEDYDHLN